MKALTAAEMREVDRLTTERFGIPSLQLMESAGRHVAEALRRAGDGAAGSRWRVCVLCGKGNNGGDGLVAARHLQAGAMQVKVYLFGKPEELRGDAATNFQRWAETGGQVAAVTDETSWKEAWPEIAGAHAIIDGIFGTGFRGAVSGIVGRAIEDINGHSRKATSAWPPLILAVDTPSGLPSDGQAAEGTVLCAHRTVTFTAPKPGQLISPHGAAVGTLEVVSIGSPAGLVEEIGKGSLRWLEPQEFAGLPLVRPAESHKGLYGHLLVVAGSLGKSGAAVMCGYGALRAGAGLVTVATPDVVLPMVAGAHPELMSEPLVSTEAGTASSKNQIEMPPMRKTRDAAAMARLAKQTKIPFERIQEGKTVLAVGPGLGTHPETQAFIRSIARGTDKPVVLDADGLNAFAGCAEELRERKSKFLAITPHPGEMSRLLEISTKEIQAERVKAAQDAARKWNVHVVLKGAHTIVTSPDGQVFVNTTGNPGLAKGGSGDVLTGILGGLTAQFGTEDWTRVLALGVYLHGAAADLAVCDTDPSGLLASEVADAVPRARCELLQELQRRD
jgi:ADP-dependent NAD(P)H-hydrate dehydratase / NAD(P)H-hydrate epimerase